MMELYEWTEHFINFRNTVRKNEIDLKKLSNKIEVNIKNKKEKEIYLIGEKLKTIFDYNTNSKNKIYFVCLNLKENIHFLYENWDKISGLKHIFIMFVEPNKNDKLILKPHLHNKISEKNNLHEGLISLHKSLKDN